MSKLAITGTLVSFCSVRHISSALAGSGKGRLCARSTRRLSLASKHKKQSQDIHFCGTKSRQQQHQQRLRSLLLDSSAHRLSLFLLSALDDLTHEVEEVLGKGTITVHLRDAACNCLTATNWNTQPRSAAPTPRPMFFPNKSCLCVCLCCDGS